MFGQITPVRMKRLTFHILMIVFLGILLGVVSTAEAQTEVVLYTFCSSGGLCEDGANPDSQLSFDGKGNLYGTTLTGGAYGSGTVFELSPNGKGGWEETVLYNFSGGADGAFPSTVIFDEAGNLYGTASSGGSYGNGVVFELSPSGSWSETVLHSFAGGTDGASPGGGVIRDVQGNLYGATLSGGSSGEGTVYEVSPTGNDWTEQIIYNTGTDNTRVVMDRSGNIFGATTSSVFELSPNGNGEWNSTVIHTFAGAPKDGYYAEGSPILDQYGNLYGTTASGGVMNFGAVYRLSPVTRGRNKGTWKEKLLYSFKERKVKPIGPVAGVILDTLGNIYGTTFGGGDFFGGTVFELIAPVGKGSYTEKTLWSFSDANGSQPYQSLVMDSSGNLYGTTYGGGVNENGLVFEVIP